MPKLALCQFWTRLMARAQTVGEAEPKTTSKKRSWELEIGWYVVQSFEKDWFI